MSNGPKLKKRDEAKAVACSKPDGKSLEGAIPKLARSGELAKSAQQAVRRLKRKGIPITFSRGLEIVVQRTSGTKEIVGRIKPAKYQPPAGVLIIEE